MNRLIKFLLPVAVGIVLSLLPIPQGINPKGWYLFCVFVSTILGIIFKPLPMGPVAMMGLLAATLTGSINLAKEGLTGYGSSIVWLIVYVFFIARGFIKTKLGTRIAYFFVSILGKNTLGLGYGLVFTELLIAPVIPSNAARAGGVMYPILKSIAESLGSSPEDGTERKIGSFLTQVSFHGNLITSAMFLTAMAANPIIQALAVKHGAIITWTNWAITASVPGLISLIIMPLVLYFVYPPQAKVLPEAVAMAKGKLKEMGPMSRNEWTMISIFGVMLILWIFEEQFGISSTTTALLGLCLMLITEILTWNDILNEHEAWHTLVWISILVMMSKYLDEFGFIGWFSNSMGGLVAGMEWHSAFIFLALIYFYSHYFFASNTAHVSSMYAAFLAVAVTAGAPPLLAALVLGFCSSMFSSMTHYGSTAGVMFFGAGYVPIATWWGLGLLISIVNILIWLVCGGVWWKVLGLW